MAKHPKTTFVFCHFANLDYDLTRLGKLLDRYPNMFVDNAAQYAETAATPRAAAQFYQKHPDRVLYGSDMPYHERMFGTTFRILESLDDEHFYEQDLYFNFNHHWPLHGFGPPDDVLKKVYSDNARRVFPRASAEWCWVSSSVEVQAFTLTTPGRPSPRGQTSMHCACAETEAKLEIQCRPAKKFCPTNSPVGSVS